MFKKIIIVLIVVICISSGAFAILSNHLMDNTIDNTNNDANNDDVNINNDAILINEVNVASSSELTLNNIINDFGDLQYTYGYVANVDGELRHYVNEYGAYYLESEGLADRYIQCVDCGGFIPIGPINNPLPEAAICHHNDMRAISIDAILNSSEYGEFSVSRDKAYNVWVERGMPVCDDIHSEVNIYKVPTDYYEYTRCNECHGFIPLIDNGHLPDEALCHHYNGSLNVNDIPKDNLYMEGQAQFIFAEEDYALNEIIGGSLNYDDYHIYGKYLDNMNHGHYEYYHAITYDDITNYLENNIKPEGSLSFDIEKNTFNSSEENLDNSFNVFNMGNNNSIIPYDEPAILSEENTSSTEF